MRLGEVLKHAIQIADALARAHAEGIIHRDLKPSNIMVTDQGLVKVLDFGLAKLTDTSFTSEHDATRTIKAGTEEGKIVGTVAYMSPEQARSAGPSTPTSGRKDARRDTRLSVYILETAWVSYAAHTILHISTNGIDRPFAPAKELQCGGISRLARPSSDQSDQSAKCFRVCGFGFEPVKQRVEIAYRIECNAMLLHLWPHAAQDIVNPSSELWIIANGYFNSHAWRRHPSLQEAPVENEFHVHVRPGALERLVDQRSAHRS